MATIAEARARDTVVEGLSRVSQAISREGMAVVAPRGGMIRPLLAWAVQTARGWEDDDRFWRAVAAVQYAHEASLVHDDILDDAQRRRNERTFVADHGVKAALVRGDHLLTSAYRLAAETESLDFVQLFARALERTVAGEVRQARSSGSRLAESEYRSIIEGKSGELIGCALAAGAAVRKDASAPGLFDLGRRLGICYQRLDDLIDYCPDSASGKPPLQDYRNRHWTWPLDECEVDGFGLDPEAVAEHMHALTIPGTALSPARRCLEHLEEEIGGLRRDFEAELGRGGLVPDVLEGWRVSAQVAVERAERLRRTEGAAATGFSPVQLQGHHADSWTRAGVQRRKVGLSLPEEHEWNQSLSRHARTFSFASLWFPRAERQRVADVYAFCRFTDDLVDRTAGLDPDELHRQLDDWLGICRTAWEGREGRHPFLDRVMRDAAESGVPFRVVEELVEGMRMDLRVSRYASLADLRIYTHRVAGVVGVWLTHLFGVHTPRTLDRASLLGHAMQVTNILRDVGEDLDRGRIYLPQDMLGEHGLTVEDLTAMRTTGVSEPGYARLLEALMQHADAAYDAALDAVPDLPRFFRRPVVVAARVYQGIHEEIRRNGYDNLRKRAHTSAPRKAVLAVRALTEVRLYRRHPLRTPARVGSDVVTAGADPQNSA